MVGTKSWSHLYPQMSERFFFFGMFISLVGFVISEMPTVLWLITMYKNLGSSINLALFYNVKVPHMHMRVADKDHSAKTRTPLDYQQSANMLTSSAPENQATVAEKSGSVRSNWKT